MRLIIYILLFSPMVSLGQITFFNSYGGDGNDYGKSVVTALDTSYTVIGATESFGEGNTDMYLFNIDSLGDLKWSNTFGGSNVDWGMDLKQTIDTGYILCGYSNSYSWDYDIFIVKTDQNGDSLWTRTYGGTDWDFGYSIETTSDTGYVIAGETYSYGTGLSDAYIIKLDNLGDTLWTKIYGGAGKDAFFDVIETYSGDLLFAGSTTSVDGDTDYWLVKTDNIGNELWQYTAGDSLDDVINSVIELTDSNYFFIGNKESIIGTNSVLEFHKISESGSYSYGNNYDLPNEETGNFILQYANETDVILGGSINSVGNGGYDVLGIKISQWGFGSIFSTDGTNYDDITEEADTTADNGIVIVGTTDGTVNGIKSVFVMKTDANLDISIPITDVFDITSVEDIILEPELSLYPIPASDIIKIKGRLKNGAFTIYNILGEIVLTGICDNNQISISQLKSGVFVIEFPEESKGVYKFTKI